MGLEHVASRAKTNPSPHLERKTGVFHGISRLLVYVCVWVHVCISTYMQVKLLAVSVCVCMCVYKHVDT